MDPMTLALIMGGASAANEATTGRQNRTQDAILKAMAYRMKAYDRSIDPGEYQVREVNPVGQGIQSGLGAYGSAKKWKNDEAITNFFNAKGAQSGGMGSSIADAQAVSGADEYQGLDAAPSPDYFKDVRLGDSNWKDDSAYNRLNRARLSGRIG